MVTFSTGDLVRPAQKGFMMLAMLLGVAGFSLSVSAFAIPPIPQFRAARRQARVLAAAGLLGCVVLFAFAVRA